MRVSSSSFTNSLLNQLGQISARQTRLQNQAATGQRIQAPEDDPAAVRRVLSLQVEGKTVAQYQANVNTLQERATASYQAMNSVKKISDRAGEIATLADGHRSSQELQSYSDEVTHLIEQAVQDMNSQDQGDYIFGGTKTDRPPFVLTQDPNGRVASVTYQGNTTVPDGQIAADSDVTATVPGANDTGSGARGFVTDTRVGADFFNHLISLQNHLQTAATDTTAATDKAAAIAAIATTDRPALAKDEDNIIYNLGSNAAVQTRLTAASQLAQSRSTSLRGLVSQQADADLAQTLVKLNQTQTAYQAALQTGATIMNQSLLNYLR